MRELGMPDGHRAELTRRLHLVRRRWALARRLRAFGRLAGGGALALLLLRGVDVTLAPADVPLLLLGGVLGFSIVALAGFEAWRVRTRPSDRQVARLVEERCSDLDDRVVTATAVADPPESPLHHLLLRDAVERLQILDPSLVVPDRQVRGAMGRAALAAVACLLAMGVSQASWGRMARLVWLYSTPAGVSLAVEPGDVRVPVGETVRVRVTLTGEPSWVADGTSDAPAVRLTDEQGVVEVPMAPAGDGWAVEIPAIERDVVYQVGLAAFTSPEFWIDALVPPRVERVDVTYEYPGYTGLGTRVEEDGGDIYAPVGTRVRLRIETNEPITAGVVEFDDGRQLALSVTDGEIRSPVFGVEADGSYRVAVTSADGLGNVAPVAYFIRATIDRPPVVTVVRPGGDREITSLEEVTIEARASDDHFVDRLDLVYTVSGGTERTIEFDTVAGATVEGTRTLYVEDLDVEPGDFITFFVQAAGPGPAALGTARSDIFFLEVRPFDNEFEEAQSQSGAGQAMQDIGRLATVQKEIIVASWRLESQARSAAVDADIRTVAEAQAELRIEAGRAAEQALGQGPDVVRGVSGPDPQNAARAAAVEAMGRAERAIEAHSVAEAIPHEMTALNELLRAQAAIRRRQVSSQRASGGAGSGAQEDLSALFDRELRRDQETNYETERRASSESASEPSEAIERLRSLAERQAELNQRLGEQADLAPEERRRELARLLREQQALRDELERVGEELGDSQASGSESGQSGTGAPGEVADEMRQAMRELRRDDKGAARASGARALDALRELQRELGGGANDQQRLGELQRDAQTLAEAQRDLAAAAEGRRSEAFSDQLGDRQKGLADRVARLQESLDALVGGDSSHPAAGAGRTLEEQAIEARMRDAAAAEADADEVAALAAILEAVAGELRVAATADRERRQLLADLEAVRALRQALEALDGDTDSAQTRPQAGEPTGAESDAPTQSGQSTTTGQDGDAGMDARQAVIDRLAGAPGVLDALRRQLPELAGDLDRWAEQWRSSSAPGTDPAGIDPSVWVTLRRHLDTALGQFEAERASALAALDESDRLAPGAGDPVPDRYRALVDAYYRGLAGAAVSRSAPSR